MVVCGSVPMMGFVVWCGVGFEYRAVRSSRLNNFLNYMKRVYIVWYSNNFTFFITHLRGNLIIVELFHSMCECTVGVDVRDGTPLVLLSIR